MYPKHDQILHHLFTLLVVSLHPIMVASASRLWVSRKFWWLGKCRHRKLAARCPYKHRLRSFHLPLHPRGVPSTRGVWGVKYISAFVNVGSASGLPGQTSAKAPYSGPKWGDLGRLSYGG